MRAIFYSNRGNEKLGEYRHMISNLPKSLSVECICNYDMFLKRLFMPKDDETMVVYMVSCDDELSRLYQNRDLLWNTRLVLVLNGRSRDTLYLAHRMYPRFIGYSDQRFEDVGAVIKRIADQSMAVGSH
jgi:hypothetical protein